VSDDEDQEFYSVYSVRRRFEEMLDFWAICRGQSASPWPPLIFTFNFG
jgi:hypothetical protein